MAVNLRTDTLMREGIERLRLAADGADPSATPAIDVQPGFRFAHIHIRRQTHGGLATVGSFRGQCRRSAANSPSD